MLVRLEDARGHSVYVNPDNITHVQMVNSENTSIFLNGHEPRVVVKGHVDQIAVALGLSD